LKSTTMNKQKSLYYRAMFYSAACFNWFAGVMWFIDFESMYHYMGGGVVPQAPLFDLILQTLSLIIILFGGVYFSIARDLGSQVSRAFAVVGTIGKIIFAVMFYVYAAQGAIPLALAGLITGDLIYTFLFLEYILFQKNINKQPSV